MVKRPFFGVEMAQIVTENQNPISFKVFYGPFQEKSMKKWSKGTKFGHRGAQKIEFFDSDPKINKRRTSFSSFSTHKHVRKVILYNLRLETGF